MTPLKSAILTHASDCKLTIDADFVSAILADVKNLGVLNPKTPNSFVQAGLKTLSPKLTPGPQLPGISAFSVPITQKFDYAGGNASHFRAFKFLVTVFEFDGVRKTVIDDALIDGPASLVMREILGEAEWNLCVDAIKKHVHRAVQAPFVDKGEKQVFWKTSEKDYLIVSPLADTLPIELAARVRDRKSADQFFSRLYFHAGGERFQNSGVMATELAGALPKLMSMPPASRRENSMLPEAVAGKFLALEFNVQNMNVTGTSIAAGFGNVTAALGFSDAIRRKLSDAGVEIKPESIALGFSNTNFHGEYKNGQWIYSVQKGTRQASAGKFFALPVAEVTASARVHVALRLEDSVSPEIVPAVVDALVNLRFAGGSIFDPLATIHDDAEIIFEDWGSNVWFVADRQSEIENAGDKLDAALDCLMFTEQADGRWKPVKPNYGLASVGYQGIEPPRPRSGLRDVDCRHIFAAGIVGLMEWVPANECAGDQVFWAETWDNKKYSCLGIGGRI